MRRRDERGASAFEFTLVFTFVIFPLLMGTLQYGYHYWSLQTAAATAREAARRLAVGTDPVCTRSEAVGRASGPALGGVTVSYSPTTGQPGIGQVVEVTVEYDSLHLAFLPLPDGGRVSQTAEARVQKVRAGTTADPYLTC